MPCLAIHIRQRRMNAVQVRQPPQRLVVEEKRTAKLPPLHPRLRHQGRDIGRRGARRLQPFECRFRQPLVAHPEPVPRVRILRRHRRPLPQLRCGLLEPPRVHQHTRQHLARLTVLRLRLQHHFKMRNRFPVAPGHSFGHREVEDQPAVSGQCLHQLLIYRNRQLVLSGRHQLFSVLGFLCLLLGLPPESRHKVKKGEPQCGPPSFVKLLSTSYH